MHVMINDIVKNKFSKMLDVFKALNLVVKGDKTNFNITYLWYWSWASAYIKHWFGCTGCW